MALLQHGQQAAAGQPGHPFMLLLLHMDKS
jgi:hypothetical protein